VEVGEEGVDVGRAEAELAPPAQHADARVAGGDGLRELAVPSGEASSTTHTWARGSTPKTASSNRGSVSRSL
jgi:hypothetical protein